MRWVKFQFDRRMVAVTTAALVTAGVGVGVLGMQSASAASGCSVNYTVSSQWQGGFGASITVTNYGATINGWKLSWTFPAGQTVSQMWNGAFTQSGSQVTASNISWNGTIGSGASINFGFNGAWNGSNPVPSVFTLNGSNCTGPATDVSASASSPSTAPSSPASPSASPSRPASPSASVSPSASAPASPSSSAATSPLIDINVQVTREAAYGTNNVYTVFRPSDPASVGRALPVLAFGNGACAHTDINEVIQALSFVAAHGFVVVDTGSVSGASNGVSSGSPIPSLLTDAISWAQKENARTGAALYQRLDLTKIATAGHSCGGLEALVAGEDSRVKSVVSMDSGFFADGSFGYQRSEVNKLHTPVMFMDGGSSDIAYDNARANYDLVKVPAVLAEQSQAGHSGYIQGVRNGGSDRTMMTEGFTTVIQFLDFTLYGNASARSFILGSSGLATKPYWTVKNKNF